MKKFILKILGFIALFVLLIFALFFLLPPTPRTSKSLLFAEIKKDSLLINVHSPRIIFVGGSNLSFGLNSQTISDSLNMNPINTAIHASLGLKYMIDNTNQFVKNGDIVVIIMEYSHFYREYNFGSEELLRAVFDVNKSKVKLLNFEQILNCTPYFGKYAFSKLDITEYLHIEESMIYSVNSFNRYGDVDAHWNLDHGSFSGYGSTIDIKSYDPKTMNAIKEFEDNIRKKGAALYVSYPSYQGSSFDNSIRAIRNLEKMYIEQGFSILGTPYRYRMDDSLMFDTPYHLNKKGVDYRTQLLIEDLKSVLSHQ